jgi:nucleoside-diphosphate-sugar epimerase
MVDVRPATVCGYSPRQRLDVSVNMLTMQALMNSRITVFGGNQTRPNIHIDDITDLYCSCSIIPSTQRAAENFDPGHRQYGYEAS